MGEEDWLDKAFMVYAGMWGQNIKLSVVFYIYVHTHINYVYVKRI